ncbi:MAG: hypothetical protein V3T23_06320, partial [Nitrososphaerales archaeon]
MSNRFHDTYIGHNNHAITANPDDLSYENIAARDADTDFHVTANLNKVIRVESPLSYYILADLTPTVFISVTDGNGAVAIEGMAVVSGNVSTTTIITQGVFVDLDLNSSAALSNTTSGFTITDTDTGEVRFDGETSNLDISGLISLIVSGGKTFSVRILKHWSVLSSPDDADISFRASGGIDTIPLAWDVAAVSNDLFRLQIAN